MKVISWFENGVRKVFSQENPLSFFTGHIWKKTVGLLYMRVPFLENVYRPIIDRTRYKLYLTRGLFSTILYRYPSMKREDEIFLAHFLKPNMVYVDVGANIGTTTLAGAYAVGEKGKVIAFEPHPRTFQYLTDSVNLNPDLAKRIILKHVALGEKKGETHISDLLMNDINHVGDEGIPVELTTLDDALKDVAHIDLLKIDVEGYEKQVFLGAQEVLGKTDAIYFEVCEPNFSRFHYTADDLFEILEGANFTIHSVNENDHSLTQVHKGYRSSGSEAYENLLALRKK